MRTIFYPAAAAVGHRPGRNPSVPSCPPIRVTDMVVVVVVVADLKGCESGRQWTRRRWKVWFCRLLLQIKTSFRPLHLTQHTTVRLCLFRIEWPTAPTGLQTQLINSRQSIVNMCK